MPRTNPRKQKYLTEDQISHLAKLICQAGDDPETKSRAMLVLMDEIELRYGAEGIAPLVKEVAFSLCGEDPIAPYVQLIRGEVFQ